MKKVPIWLLMLALSGTSLAISSALVASRRAAAEPEPPLQWVKDVTSQSRVTIRSLEPRPGGVVVHASAKLGNTARPQELVWYLKIWEKVWNGELGQDEWRVAWEQDYVHQTFVLDAGQFENPTFDQSLDLPPSLYTVEVGVKEKRGEMVDGEVIVKNTPIASWLGSIRVQ